jgi:hypothetical protein
VKHSNTSLPQTSRADWQLLGEIQLPARSNHDDTMYTWLIEILSPLQLHMTLLNKILQSAKETAARVMHSETTMKFEHIHLLVFVPVDHTSQGQTWGFFRVEKVESAKPHKDLPDHAVEFYLYLEGQ